MPPFRSSLKVFTKILCPVVGFLRSKGFRCVIYLDDILFLDHDKSKLMVMTPRSLGFPSELPQISSGTY